MLCTIWGFHGSDYEECRLLGRYAVWLLVESTFPRNVPPNRRFLQECHGIKSQKTSIFMPFFVCILCLNCKTTRNLLSNPPMFLFRKFHLTSLFMGWLKFCALIVHVWHSEWANERRVTSVCPQGM
jgi:hypothetical protein